MKAAGKAAGAVEAMAEQDESYFAGAETLSRRVVEVSAAKGLAIVAEGHHPETLSMDELEWVSWDDVQFVGSSNYLVDCFAVEPFGCYDRIVAFDATGLENHQFVIA